jgi:hypothetical protein
VRQGWRAVKNSRPSKCAFLLSRVFPPPGVAMDVASWIVLRTSFLWRKWGAHRFARLPRQGDRSGAFRWLRIRSSSVGRKGEHAAAKPGRAESNTGFT